MVLSMMLLPTNPMVWFLILAVLFFLFGAGSLPKFARAIGESKRALKEGLSETGSGQKPK